jgi:2-C-methyl-D-erythritol 4-phosphate cytidylyltransferase
MNWAAVVVAAGRGTRFGRPKQLLELAGLPMVGWSMRTFAQMPEVCELVIVTEPESIEAMRRLAERVAGGRDVRVFAGGASRQASCYAGLQRVSLACEAAFVHDGARPLVDAGDCRTAMREVRAGRGALLAAPVVDTIKAVDAQTLRVMQTLDRAQLWAAQTPQFALTADLLHAHERARAEGVEATDDAALLERIGIEVIAVPSTTPNFKVTLPEDFERASDLLQLRAPSPLQVRT